jgi:hypothetical protein
MSLELLLGYLALCLLAGICGRNRRIGFWGFFFCSIVSTPVVSLCFLYFATPRKVGARIS